MNKNRLKAWLVWSPWKGILLFLGSLLLGFGLLRAGIIDSMEATFLNLLVFLGTLGWSGRF